MHTILILRIKNTLKSYHLNVGHADLRTSD